MKPSLIRSALIQMAFLILVSGMLTWATAFWGIQWKRPPEVRSLSIAAIQKDLSDVVWVDVRDFDRFDSAHIPDALFFSEAEHDKSLAHLLRLWKPKTRVVIYGEGPGSDRAQRVALQLKKDLHSADVFLLEGGWAAWPRN